MALTCAAFAQSPGTAVKPLAARTAWEAITWAKQNGISTVTFRAPLMTREEPDSLPVMVSQRTLVVARLLSQKTIPLPPNDETLVTWYKFQITETLSGEAPVGLVGQPGCTAGAASAQGR